MTIKMIYGWLSEHLLRRTKMLPKQAIEEFKEIYLIEEGMQLSDQEAVSLSNNLMNLFKSLIKTSSKFEQSTVSRIDNQ